MNEQTRTLNIHERRNEAALKGDLLDVKCTRSRMPDGRACVDFVEAWSIERAVVDDRNSHRDTIWPIPVAQSV